MNKAGEAALPNLEPEYALLWAVIQRAKLDARYTQRRGTLQPDVSAQDQAEARAWLEELRSDLQPVCA